MNISGVHGFLSFTVIIFVSDETHARMPRNRTMSEFQAKAQKSSKSRLYLQDLLTFLGDQGIGAASGRVGML